MKSFVTMLSAGSFFLIVGAGQSTAQAESPAVAETLPICTNYRPNSSWGPVGSAAEEDLCLPGYAFMGHQNVSSIFLRDKGAEPIAGYCCPLPSGVLTDEHRFLVDVCPPDFVATGGRTVPSSSGEKQVFELRCTKIDTRRYVLVGGAQSVYFGGVREYFREMLLKFLGLKQRYSTRFSLPVALRYGLFRDGRSEWNESGCAGYPWGSVLTERGGGECSGFRWAVIHDRLPDGMPGAAVKVFEDCEAVDDILSEYPKCIQAYR